MTTISFDPLTGTDRIVNEHALETVLDAQHVELPAASDPTPEQFMRTVEIAGTLDFWDDPGEDLYTLDDGQPL